MKGRTQEPTGNCHRQGCAKAGCPEGHRCAGLGEPGWDSWGHRCKVEGDELTGM